ncbi:MAG: hypothetical protein NC305_17245 [Lachnospiraceae bacterium]|nr:hypothetical protein [Lachnospiraceae bacterium]
MPAFCNPEYPMLEAMHGGLIRKSACALGSVCDYWIVGDQCGYLEKHPAKTDSKGYVYNG